jgi:hypothetical protein
VAHKGYIANFRSLVRLECTVHQISPVPGMDWLVRGERV